MRLEIVLLGHKFIKVDILKEGLVLINPMSSMNTDDFSFCLSKFNCAFFF